MRINFNPQNIQISFNSHSKNVRKADDIMRKSKSEYPLVSSTKTEFFYNNLGEHKNIDFSKPVPHIYKIHSLISSMRDVAENKQGEEYRDNPYLETMEGLRKLKFGNCFESAVTAMAALNANGFDANQAVLLLTHKLLDENGKVAYKFQSKLDHTFAITTMNTPNTPKNKTIIVDPWLHKAGTWQEVCNDYKCLFTNTPEAQKVIERNREFFARCIEFDNPQKSLSDYSERISFDYKPYPNADKISQGFKEKYPELSLNK